MNGAVNWSCLSLQAWTKITRSEMGGEGGGGNLHYDLIVVHRSFLTNLQKTSVLVSSNHPILVICQVTGHTDFCLGL